MTPDLINGLFELAGVAFIFTSIRKLHQDKKVRGVSWAHVAYFSFWGIWNLFYYPSLGQWFSLAGGIGIVLANTVWLLLMLYYLQAERKANAK
jgi:hypothetical protein